MYCANFVTDTAARQDYGIAGMHSTERHFHIHHDVSVLLKRAFLLPLHTIHSCIHALVYMLEVLIVL
jgi:hypothetical protein